ncbi:MAG: flavodoxin family protein [Rhizomicrobium sp.]
MSKVVVVYHSGYGHTAEQAKAVAAGAGRVPGTQVELIRIEGGEKDFTPVLAKLEAADAIILGSPTYMGSVSGPFKTFMDATSKVWGKLNDKIAAGFTNSASHSGDKLNSLIQLSIFAAQHGMVWVNLGLMPGNNHSKGSPEDLNRLGGFLGAMAQSPADGGPEVGPTASDKRTAEHLGQRVAEAARRWRILPLAA